MTSNQQEGPRGDLLLGLARRAVETYVREHVIIPVPHPLPKDQERRQAAFVTLIKAGAQRGCVGSLVPLQPTLAGEIISNALAAAVRDPRFTPVKPEELIELEYAIDLLEALEPLASPVELDPACEGVVVRAGKRVGVALPATSGLETAALQIRYALQRAEIDPSEAYRMERFRVMRLTTLSQ